MLNTYPLAVLLFPGGLFALVLGLALKGVDRRLAARLQRRVGPPLAQPFFDLVKLAHKRTMPKFLPVVHIAMASSTRRSVRYTMVAMPPSRLIAYCKAHR